MDTGQFLRRYFYVYLYVVAFFLGCGAMVLRSVEVVGGAETFASHPVIVIDAGHGGIDGGATGVSGAGEKGINLAVSERLEAILGLMGFDTVMTRTTDDSLATEGDTVRQQKQSDLRNRVEIVNSQASAILVSIHQNHYSDGRYSGPQVFYSPGAESMAAKLQEALNQALSPASRRTAKEASGIYVMEQIAHPGVLVECGFLSNAAEEQKLLDAEHQKKLACIIAAVVAAYADGAI